MCFQNENTLKYKTLHQSALRPIHQYTKPRSPNSEFPLASGAKGKCAWYASAVIHLWHLPTIFYALAGALLVQHEGPYLRSKENAGLRDSVTPVPRVSVLLSFMPPNCAVVSVLLSFMPPNCAVEATSKETFLCTGLCSCR